MTEHSDSFYLGAYWDVRQESAGDCATRTVQLLRGLHDVHPVFERWETVARSKDDRRELDLTVAHLEPLFEPHYDDLGQLMPQIGFDLWLSNGFPRSGRGSTVSLSCGSYSERVLNSCVLYLPGDPAVRNELLDPPAAIQLISETTKAMEPDWAVLISDNLREFLDPFRRRRYGGIVTFLSSRKFPVPAQPEPPSKRIDLPGLGSMILLTEERFSMEDAEHLEIAKRVTKSLRKQRVFKIMKQK